jgi:hypothetical protein
MSTMDDPGYSAIDSARVWLRTHWQLIAAPLLTLAIIAGASMWLRPKAQPSGPVNIDNPAGVVEGQPYEPHIDPAAFSTTVDNPFYPLIPGTTGTFREGNERVVVTVTASTRTVMGVETVVVRDQEFDGDRLIEDTEDWFAQDGEDNVWYFGESTAECSDGEVTGQAGSWEAGVDGAQPGIVMLGHPEVGDYYRQEYYRGHAEDVARVREVGATMTVGDTTYENVLVTEDFTTLEPGVLEHKGYAPEVGLIREGPPTGSGVQLTETGETEPTTSDPTTLCQP